MAKADLKKSTSNSAFSVKGANEEIKALKRQNIAQIDHNKTLSQTAQNRQKLRVIGTSSIPVLKKIESKQEVKQDLPRREFKIDKNVQIKRDNPFADQGTSEVNHDFALNTYPFVTATQKPHIQEQKKITFDDVNNKYMSARQGLINGASFGLVGLAEDIAKKKGIPVLPTVTSMDMMQAMTDPTYLQRMSHAQENAVKEQPIANMVGNVAGNLIGSGLLGSAAGNTVEKLGLAGGKKFAAGMGADLGVDAIIDTMPNALQDINSGEDKKTVVTNAAKNLSVNALIDLAANGLFQGIPMLKEKKKTDVISNKITDVPYQNMAAGIKDIPILDYKINSDANVINMNGFIPEQVISSVVEEPTKTLGDAYLNNLKKNISRFGTTYGSSNPDIIQLGEVARKAVDDYSSNPNKETLNNLIKSVSEFDESLNGTSVVGKKFGKGKSRDASETKIPWNNQLKGNLDIQLDSANAIDKKAVLDLYDNILNYGDKTGVDTAPVSDYLNRFMKNPTNENFDSFIKKFDELGLSVDDELRKTVNQSLAEIFQQPKKQVITILNENGMIPKLDNVEIKTFQGQEIPHLQNIAKNAESQSIITKEIPTLSNNLNIVDTTKDIEKSRYASKSVVDKSDMPEVVKEEFVNNPEIYNVLHNADTKAKADNILNANLSLNDKVSQCRQLLSQRDASAVPLGYDLSKELVNNGDINGAVDLVREMSRELTKSGQFTQSAAMTLLQENPQAAMRYAVREIDDINAKGAKKFGKKWNNISLTQEEMNALNSLQQGDTEGIKSVYEMIGNRLSKEVPSTAWEKVVELTKLNMLFNPRTHIRNTVANVLMTPIRSTADRISALGQHAAHLINPDVEITQSLTGSIGGQYKKIANEIFDTQVKPILEGSDKWEDLGNTMYKHQVFKDNKVTSGINKGFSNLSRKFGLDSLADGIDNNLKGSMLENLRNFDYWLLGAVEDDPFVKMNFNNRLASYMKAQGIKNIDDVPAEAISLATDEALKATFKDDNMLTKMLSGLKRTSGKFGEVALPFTKTPANLAMRAIDYSPVGIINTIRHSTDPAKTLDDLSKNLTGTGMIALGVILAREGMIRGALSDDKNTQAFQKQQGKQEYSIVMGNGVEIPYNWAQPAATGLIIGATINDAINGSDDGLDIAQTSFNGGKAAVNEWFALSPLQSLQELFAGNGYGNNDIAQNFINAGGDFITRFIPSLSNAIAKTNDTSQRTSFVKGNNMQTLINQSKAKIPVLRETLPVSHDTWGNEKQTASSEEQAFLNNFILPANSSTINPTGIDGEIQRLYDSTGIDKVFPKKVDWSDTVDGTKYNLDNYGYEEKQKIVGQKSHEFADSFINSDFYDQLDDEGKADALNSLYGFSNYLYQKDKYGKEVPDNYKHMLEAYEQGGTPRLMREVEFKNELKALGLSDNDTTRKLWKSGKNALEEYKKDKDIFEKHGINFNTNSNAYKALKSGGEAAMVKVSNDTNVLKKYGFDYKEGSSANTVLSEKGEAGLKIYSDIKKKATFKDSKGNNKTSNASVVSALHNSNMSDEDKGYYFSQFAGELAKGAQQAYNDLGYAGLYKYYYYKMSADTNNNNSLDSNEIRKFVYGSGAVAKSEQNYWANALKYKKAK